MKVIDGRVTLRAPEGADWPTGACADLSVISDKGPSVAVYLTPGDCDQLARWLDEMWGKTPAKHPKGCDCLICDPTPPELFGGDA